MIEKIDARLARLAARHTELSTLIQNASVELAQVEGGHAHLTDLKKEIEEAEPSTGRILHTVDLEAAAAEKAERDNYQRAMTRAEAASARFLHADDLEEQRTVTHIAAAVEEAETFPVETRLQRELARNREAAK